MGRPRLDVRLCLSLLQTWSAGAQDVGGLANAGVRASGECSRLCCGLAAPLAGSQPGNPRRRTP